MPTSKESESCSKPHISRLGSGIKGVFDEAKAGISDVVTMSWAIPKALYDANPKSFIAAVTLNALKGAQGWALTWTGMVFTTVITTGGEFGSTFMHPVCAVLAASHFAGRWLNSAAERQTNDNAIDLREESKDRVSRTLFAQKLASLGDPVFSGSFAQVRNNEWVPYNLGHFYYPLVQQAAAFTLFARTISVKASDSVLWCAAGMIVAPAIATFISTRRSVRDEERLGKKANNEWKLSNYLSNIEHVREIALSKMENSLRQIRKTPRQEVKDAAKRRNQSGFWTNAAADAVYGTCLFGALTAIASESILTKNPQNGLLLSASIIQMASSLTGILDCVTRQARAAPFIRGMQEIQKYVKEIPPLTERKLINVDAIGLKLTDIGFAFPGRNGETPVQLLDKVSVVIDPGDVVCLFGDPGCGKSTLIDILAGLRDPTAGSIEVIAGNELYQHAAIHPKEWIDNVGICAQKPPIFKAGATLADNLGIRREEGAQDSERGAMLKEDYDLAVALLNVVGLTSWVDQLNQPIGAENGGIDPSGGQQQKISLVNALLRRPKLLLLDEAFTNLDQKITFDLLRVVRNLQKSPLGYQPTVVFISHDTDQTRYADQIVVIDNKTDNKTVVSNGTYQELLASCDLFKSQCEARQGPQLLQHTGSDDTQNRFQ